jgi:hypothetical protein
MWSPSFKASVAERPVFNSSVANARPVQGFKLQPVRDAIL